jgi:hypothetical protein
VCCQKFVQRSVERKQEVCFVKVPSKLLVVVQSAAASSSAASGGKGSNEEHRTENTKTRWLPDLAELVKYLPGNLASEALNDPGKLLESLTARLGPEERQVVGSLMGALKGGVKP